MCNFPARELLAEQRRVCREADASHDMKQIRTAAAYVQETMRLRLAHEELTGCECWLEARKELDHAQTPRS